MNCSAVISNVFSILCHEALKQFLQISQCKFYKIAIKMYSWLSLIKSKLRAVRPPSKIELIAPISCKQQTSKLNSSLVKS